MTVPEFISARRSIRSFADTPVDDALLDRCIEAACLAPAPHHSRPWRWVSITTAGNKLALAESMGARWRIDLTRDGVDGTRIESLVAASVTRLTTAPALVLGCLTDDGLDQYPDADRQRAEQGMALLSLGAAVENFMLAAAALGLATCWVAAPIFCPDEARASLDLDPTWMPQALMCVGHPGAEAVPARRPAVELDRLRVLR